MAKESTLPSCVQLKTLLRRDNTGVFRERHLRGIAALSAVTGNHAAGILKANSLALPNRRN